MPYPPQRPRKSEEELQHAQEARARALVPHRFAPGRSGNLHGMSAQQHALYTEVRQLKSRLGPAVLERLAELAGLQIEEDGTVTKLPLDEVLRDNDARVVFAATNSLRDQIFGRPREGMGEAEGKEGLAARLEAARQRVLAVEAEPQTIDVGRSPSKEQGD